MGPPADLNLEYWPSGKKKNGGFVRNGFVSTEKGVLEERLRCLEEERKKIDAFKRELPLCMQLVNDAIESVRRQMKQQSGNTLPVLEEFIPIKILSQEEERKEDGLMTKEKDYKERLNWMRSAQLWIDNHDDLDLRKERAEAESFPSENSHSLSVNPDRESILQLKGGSALFKEEDVSPDLSLSTESKLSSRAPSSSPEQSATQTQRKARRCWSPELHRRFVNALHQLGGAQVATPKQIRELMKVDGLTNDEVKSHLQKYRLHTRRTGAVHSLAGGQHGNSLALMGGIWMSHEFPSSRGTRGLKQSPAQSGSPQGPLQLSVNQRTSNGSLEEDEEDDDEETKSESYSWRGAQQRSGSIGVTESSRVCVLGEGTTGKRGEKQEERYGRKE